MAAAQRPHQIDHAKLRERAQHALWIAKVEEAMELLDDLVDGERALLLEDGLIEDAGVDDEDENETPFEVALSIVETTYEQLDTELEADLIQWLAQDPEHWGIFRLTVIDPWQTKARTWRKGTPRWVQVLSTNTVIAHFQQDQYGRRRTLKL